MVVSCMRGIPAVIVSAPGPAALVLAGRTSVPPVVLAFVPLESRALVPVAAGWTRGLSTSVMSGIAAAARSAARPRAAEAVGLATVTAGGFRRGRGAIGHHHGRSFARRLALGLIVTHGCRQPGWQAASKGVSRRGPEGPGTGRGAATMWKDLMAQGRATGFSRGISVIVPWGCAIPRGISPRCDGRRRCLPFRGHRRGTGQRPACVGLLRR